MEGFVKGLYSNIFVYFPNYLIHEFAHRIVGSFAFMGAHGCEGNAHLCYPVASWITTLAGSGGECLVPLVCIVLALRLPGGRWLLPLLLYWSASTWYDAAVYVSDARASQLPLTSSDMMTNYAPGVIKGDWHYILQPIGLLAYDTVIGTVFFLVAAGLLALSVFSAWYYWTHTEEYL